jgi:hypothetical protein
MLFILYVNEEQTAHRLTLEAAKDAAASFIARGGRVRIHRRGTEHPDSRATWDYDPASSEWIQSQQ